MRLKINGTILNVFETGAENYNLRPTLLFLHYFGGSSQSWTEVIEKLSADYHCVAPDLRGFGASHEAAESFAVADYADDAADLIRVLSLENYIFAGHSMGGKIALALAARNPPGLQSLVLFAPSPPTPEPMKDAERKKLLNSHGNRCAATETVCQAAGGRLPGAVFARAIDDNLRTSETAWQAWLEKGSREDISNEVGNINVPVLIAAGAEDGNMTAELLEREIAQRISDARLTVIENAKHLLPLEVPETVASLIRGEIEEIRF